MNKKIKANNEDFAEQIKKARKFFLDYFKPKAIYTEDYDMFNMFFGGDKEVEHTIEVGDVLKLDMDKDDNVIGLEIEDFSQVLEECKNKKGWDFRNDAN